MSGVQDTRTRTDEDRLARLPLLFFAAGAFLCFNSSLHAQLRLSDVLTTETQTIDQRAPGLRLGNILAPERESQTAPEPEAPFDESTAREVLANGQQALAEGEHARAEQAAADLLNRVDRASPLYAPALYLRAEALERLGRWAEAARAGASFLSEKPPEPDALAARRLIAHAQVKMENWAEAAKHLDVLFQRAVAMDYLDRDRLIEAAEVYLQVYEPVKARRALEFVAPDARRSAGAKAVHDFWLLESLLMEDDARIPVPQEMAESQPLYHAVALRRGLLMELRGDANGARELYQELNWSREKLSPAEGQLLKTRLGGDS